MQTQDFEAKLKAWFEEVKKELPAFHQKSPVVHIEENFSRLAADLRKRLGLEQLAPAPHAPPEKEPTHVKK